MSILVQLGHRTVSAYSRVSCSAAVRRSQPRPIASLLRKLELDISQHRERLLLYHRGLKLPSKQVKFVLERHNTRT